MRRDPKAAQRVDALLVTLRAVERELNQLTGAPLVELLYGEGAHVERDPPDPLAEFTGRQSTEDALRERQSLLDSALRVAQMGSWVFDVATERLWWSPETHRLFGTNPREFRGTIDAFLATLLAEDRPHLLEVQSGVGAWPNDAFETEYRIRRPDGVVRWMFERGSVERDAAGVPVRRLGVVMDVTERRVAEEERRLLLAREQEARRRADAATHHYRALFESAPGSYLVLTPDDYTIVAVSDAYLRATMTTRAEIMGRTIFDVFPDDPADPTADGVGLVRASLERVRASGETDVMAVLRFPVARPEAAGGGFEERFWSPVNAPVTGPDGELAYIIHRAEDVTEYVRNKRDSGGFAAAEATPPSREEMIEVDIVLRGRELARANERLLQTQAVLRMAGRAAKLGGWVFALAEGVLTWSDETAVIHDEPPGFSPAVDDAVGYYEPAYRDVIRDAFRACCADGTPFDVEARIVTAQGRHFPVRALGEAVRGADGTITHVQGAFQDISTFKHSEEQLREQATLLDGASDAIVMRDLDQRVLYWNRGAEHLYGWGASDVLGRDIRALIYRDPADCLVAQRATLEHGVWSGEMAHRTRDGRSVTVLSRWTLLRDDTGEPRSILTIKTDVTEHRRLEQHLLRAQRMESIGTLAGGIAHDLNNVLSPILMSASLLQEEETDPARLEDLRTISACAERGADMVRQLLTFARGGGERRERVDLGAIAREVQRIVRDTFPKHITFRLHAPTSGWEVEGDPTQMHQLLTNLCVNARDAMPGGGTLTVSVERVVLDEVYAGMSADARPGPHVLMTVEDTGTGMPPGVIDRIFEPFFTTKKTGQGTGLGLSTVHTIVRSHRGFLNVYSEPGQGTRFRVYLPAEAPGAAAAEAPLAHSKLPRGSGELVLLVDDEEHIRTVTGRTLERFGYRVAVAANGAEAVLLYAQRRGDVAVVLTDMNMPVLDGPATIVALKSLDPAVRIVGSSGLDANARVARALDAGVDLFIPKPYTVETLLGVLSRALGNRA
jgi:PAS domain S-box-containing protein